MCKTSSHFSMSVFRHRVVVWILLAVLSFSFVPSVSFAQQPAATIKAWTGSVLVSGQAVTVGMVLHAGDTLQTGSEALVIIELSDGSIVHFGANTQVSIADLAQTATGGRVSLIKLLAGRVRALLSPDHQKPGSAFTIETPNAQVGVKFSQPDVEVSYDPAKQETVGIAHTVELIAINLLTNEKITVPVGTTVIIVGILMKIAAGTAASAIAAHVGTTAATTAAETGTTAAGTTATGTTTGSGAGTVVALSAGALAVAGGVTAIVANSEGKPGYIPPLTSVGRWNVDFGCSGGGSVSWIWDIKSDNTFAEIGGGCNCNGTWSLEGNQITLFHSIMSCTYRGTIDAAGNTMDGRWASGDGFTGCWSATRIE